MNISFKNIARVFFASALSVSLLASCSDWTEPESVKFEYQTLEQKNPELYKAYMESLRAYHASEHKVLIAKFDNKKDIPSGRADHINCVPDSTDYVILTDIDGLSEQLLADMKDLQINKATKVLGQIDIADLLKNYKAYREEWLENHKPAEKEEGGEEPAPQPEPEVMLTFAEYIVQEMPAVMAPFEKYPYDGINVIYKGTNPDDCNPDALEALKKEQQAFFAPVMEWLSKNENRLFFLEGDAHYIVMEESPVQKADYILVSAQSAMSSSEFTHVVIKVINENNVPTDRIVVVVTTISLVDPTIKEGHFSGTNPDGSDMTAIQGAAYWVNGIYGSFVPQGIAVDHIQNDYYDFKKVYSMTRSAISIMNPSPIK